MVIFIMSSWPDGSLSSIWFSISLCFSSIKSSILRLFSSSISRPYNVLLCYGVFYTVLIILTSSFEFSAFANFILLNGIFVFVLLALLSESFYWEDGRLVFVTEGGLLKLLEVWLPITLIYFVDMKVLHPLFAVELASLMVLTLIMPLPFIYD